mgnify:CR=1 FL=1
MVSLWDKILNFLKHISGGNTTIVNCQLSIVNFLSGSLFVMVLNVGHYVRFCTSSFLANAFAPMLMRRTTTSNTTAMPKAVEKSPSLVALR